MANKRSKSGKPLALEQEESDEPIIPEQTLAEHLKEIHGISLPELEQEQQGEDDKVPSLAFLTSKFKTKSAMIRYMLDKEVPKALIAKHLGVKYQHVRNVSVQQLKRGPNEDWNLSGGVSPNLNPQTKTQKPKTEIVDEGDDDA